MSAGVIASRYLGHRILFAADNALTILRRSQSKPEGIPRASTGADNSSTTGMEMLDIP
jgi:hypothetical protein